MRVLNSRSWSIHDWNLKNNRDMKTFSTYTCLIILLLLVKNQMSFLIHRLIQNFSLYQQVRSEHFTKKVDHFVYQFVYTHFHQFFVELIFSIIILFCDDHFFWDLKLNFVLKASRIQCIIRSVTERSIKFDELKS
jgi:hypothetical protein